LHPLESRALLSAAPVLAAPTNVTSPALIKPHATAPTLTVADRQELANNWIGSNAATLQSLIAAGDTAGFDAELLNYMRNRTNRNYYFDPDDADDIIAFFDVDAGLKKQKANKLVKADAILAHKFPEIVNSSTYDVQLPAGTIDWVNQPSATGNTEFLYSLNRHFYWNDLSMAYRFTGDVKYVKEMRIQLDSWSRQYGRLKNPDDWRQTRPKWDLFVTAERVKFWMFSYFMVVDTPGWTAASNALFLHRMLVQGDFLNRVTDVEPLTSNKTTGRGTALYELALLFPEFKRASTWQANGQAIMFNALDAQFRADGGHYEQSPQYHGGAMNGFLDAYQLTKLNGLDWSDRTVRKLRRIFNYFFQILSPDGTQPALSDSYRSQGTIVFTTARLVLNQPQWPKSRPRLNDVWTLGVAAVTPLLSEPTNGVLSGRGQTASYLNSGYHVTRSGDDPDARQLILDAGPKGGLHGQFDLLNFELYGYGHPLIADPGLLSYSATYADQRAVVVSTPAHNTISIDGKNHAASEKSTIAKLTQFTNTTAGVQIAATSYGYTGLAGAPVVARNVFHNHGDIFLVVDFAAATATHTYSQSFNLFTTSATAFVNGVIRTTTGNGDVMLKPLLSTGQTTSTKNAVLSNSAPPAGTTTGRRFAISHKASSALFATLVVTYEGATPPNVSAKWLKTPTATRTGQIEINDNGVKSVVLITRPDLSATPAAVKPAVVTTEADSPATILPVLAVTPSLGNPFSNAPIEEQDSLFD
jgi:hypothetical protein